MFKPIIELIDSYVSCCANTGLDAQCSVKFFLKRTSFPWFFNSIDWSAVTAVYTFLYTLFFSSRFFSIRVSFENLWSIPNFRFASSEFNNLCNVRQSTPLRTVRSLSIIYTYIFLYISYIMYPSSFFFFLLLL